MAIYKRVSRDPKQRIIINGRTYKYQCGHDRLSGAEKVAKEWRRQGLFVKTIMVHNKRGGGYLRPAYLTYIAPKKTKKQPKWFKW